MYQDYARFWLFYSMTFANLNKINHTNPCPPLTHIHKQSLLNVEIRNSSEISCLNQHNSRMQSDVVPVLHQAPDNGDIWGNGGKLYCFLTLNLIQVMGALVDLLPRKGSMVPIG
jgi:hypothetical protein